MNARKVTVYTYIVVAVRCRTGRRWGGDVKFCRNYHLVDDARRREEDDDGKIIRYLKGIMRRLIRISAFILYTPRDRRLYKRYTDCF